MTRKNYEVYDRHGRLVDRDGEELRDGDRLRVPMLLKDGTVELLEDWQREIVWAHRFGLNDAADLHRPGPRRCSDEGTAAKAKAYNDSVTELVDAWKVPPIPAAEPRAKITGECVPDARQDAVPRTMDFADAQRIRDRAWLESVAELESAWKGPAR